MPNPLNKEEGERIKQLSSKQVDIFLKTHFIPSTDLLTKILKAHLYIEGLINEIIKNTFPYPNDLIGQKFYAKILLLNATGPVLYKPVFSRLKALNAIRNNFSHNLNYKPSETEANKLILFTSIKETNNERKIIRGLMSLIGSLEYICAITKSLPYLMTCLRNEALFDHDKGFNKKEVIKLYGIDLKDFFNGLKIKKE